jgi:hypothetical protein
VVPVGISRGVPRFKLPYRYRMLRLLSPTRETFSIRNAEAFERAYLSHLQELGVKQITDRLRQISCEHGGSPLALLCYEDVHDGEFCHRRMFASWWKEQTGQEVLELDDGVEVRRRAPIQETLFETKEIKKGD